MNRFSQANKRPVTSNRFSALLDCDTNESTKKKINNSHSRFDEPVDKTIWSRKDSNTNTHTHTNRPLKTNNRWKFAENKDNDYSEDRSSSYKNRNSFQRKRSNYNEREKRAPRGMLISKYSRNKKTEEKPKEFNMEEELFPSLGGGGNIKDVQEAPKQTWAANFSDVAKKADERDKLKMKEIENRKIEEIKKRQERRNQFYRHKNIDLNDEDVRKEILRIEKEEEHVYIREQRRLERRIYEEEYALYEEEMAMDYDSDEEYYKDNINEHLGKSKRW
tara:strand:+ start:6103 stop:6930 length:828 start_codon:yes stop_codon:yes gene_type:complete